VSLLPNDEERAWSSDFGFVEACTALSWATGKRRANDVVVSMVDSVGRDSKDVVGTSTEISMNTVDSEKAACEFGNCSGPRTGNEENKTVHLSSSIGCLEADLLQNRKYLRFTLVTAYHIMSRPSHG